MLVIVGFSNLQCSTNITEYLLLKKLTVGLSAAVLKQQVYQMCDSINNVDTLRTMCCSYEAVREDTARRSSWQETKSWGWHRTHWKGG